MPEVPEDVWITLRGERFHESPTCQGILDGHAKAAREGKQQWEPDKWPVRLAASGWPRLSGRDACLICLPGAKLPVGGDDDPAKVGRAKGGRIAQALQEPRMARNQARAAELRAADQERAAETRATERDRQVVVFPLGHELSEEDIEREAMREAMTPLDADYSSRDR